VPPKKPKPKQNPLKLFLKQRGMEDKKVIGGEFDQSTLYR
jgi:hypothetical protein